MTYSVVARDLRTGDLGVAAQSRFLALGSLVCHARAGVGAVATQALVNPTYGDRGLQLLASGASPTAALDALVAADELGYRRQACVIDSKGRTAAHSGTGCQHWAGHLVADGVAVAGNMLVDRKVVESMLRAIEDTAEQPLPERLVAALEAGQAAGGDARGQQSAALLVVRADGGYGGLSDRLVDLRVDDHSLPITELRRLLGLHRLYFLRPDEADLIEIDQSLARQLAELLEIATGVAFTGADLGAVWIALDRWAGRENLEERMVRPGVIDRMVQTHLRTVVHKTDLSGRSRQP